MDKRSFFLNNPTSKSIRITELNISLPPGVSNLFQLNADLTFEQIDYSLRKGTLRAAMENKLCLIVPDIAVKSISADVIIRNPHQIQVFNDRARFQIAQMEVPALFDPIDDAGLFENDYVKPARELEEELNRQIENIQAIDATIKEVKLPEKPIENRYIPTIKAPETQQKIKNDLQMGYETCNGLTAIGERCMRRAKTGKKYCGLHKKQE